AATEELDDIWILPCADHAFGKELAPFVDRVRMCHLAFRHLGGGAQVLDLESRLPKPSYTVDTLRAVHQLRPGIKPAFIAGSDILPELHKWKEPDEVQRLARLIIVPRKGFAGGARLQIDLPELSSTDVRGALASGEDVSGLIDRLVLEFIEKRSLYFV